MIQSVLSVVPNTPIDIVAKKMSSEDTGSAIIVNKQGHAIGIITEKDLLTRIVAQKKKPSSISVKSVMSTPIITIGPNEQVEAAARLLQKKRIRRLPVVDNGKLVGILTEDCIVGAIPTLLAKGEIQSQLPRRYTHY